MPLPGFSNRRDFAPQCVRFLDRAEKARLFDLYTRFKVNGVSLLNEMISGAEEEATNYPEAAWISRVLPDEHQVQVKGMVNFFSKARSHVLNDNTIAILLSARPHRLNMTVDQASALFQLVDLRPALGDYMSGKSHEARGGIRRSNQGCSLPFTFVNIWFNLRIQRRSAQDRQVLLPPQTVQALPPSANMIYGRGNTVIIDEPTSLGVRTQDSPDKQIAVVQVHAILQPVSTPGEKTWPLCFYGSRFKFSPLHKTQDDVFTPAPDIDMFILDRHYRRAGSEFMGDVFDLEQIELPVQLVPRFSRTSEILTCNTSMHDAESFYLNNYWSKENFHAILSYQ